MTLCPKCSTNNDPSGRFCSACGSPLEFQTEAFENPSRPPRAASDSSTSGSDSSHHGRFLPGAELLGRYRIVSLAGQGGMGEVYRADDLKLGHPVALKFMPPELVGDALRLELFHNEVRLSRQISHPNVCRVYDIADYEGLPFLSMEYIEGGDLKGLLRRIGRLPKDKGVELARQLCSGLAAAHDKGVLHRDLKPANIMIDDNGRVRITDFGLARLSSDNATVGQVVGTRNYMAPEQLSRGESNIQSDIYSLGLILHEMFTGEAVHQGKTVSKIHAAHEDSSVTRPSDVIPDIDPVIDRVIGRCLERDAHSRPRSAHEVAAALPGSDPLAAAVAAGETPSPDMVAAAGTRGLLPPRIGAVLLLVLGICLLGYPYLSDSQDVVARASVPKKPDVLVAEAQEFIRELGYEVEGQDHVSWIRPDVRYIRHLMREHPGPDRWDALENEPPSAHFFWFRQGPPTIRPSLDGVTLSRWDRTYPPPGPGTIDIKLDMQGRLIGFVARPPRVEPLASPGETELPWDRLFERAGLDRARFSSPEDSIDPVWNLSVDCDRRWTWTGTFSDENPLTVRVEAGSVRGRVAVFQILAPWSLPTPESTGAIPRTVGWVSDITGVIALLCVGILVFMGVRNFRRGRGDRRGSFRIGLFIFVCHMGSWLLGWSRLPQVTDGFIGAANHAMAISLFWGFLGWLSYMALEPYLRRQCPHRIISWSRLLTGHWKDPLAGRDILLGVAIGTVLTVGGAMLVGILRSVLDLPEALTAMRSWTPGMQHTIAALMLRGVDSAAVGLLTMFVPLVTQYVFRKPWIAIALTWMFFFLFSALPLWNGDSFGDWAILALVVGGIRATVFLVLLLRVGLLASSTCLFVSMALWTSGTSSLGEWHGQPILTTIIVVGGLGILGFVHSLAGRKFIGDSLDS